MFSLGRIRQSPDLARISLLIDQYSPVILTSIITMALYHGYLLILQSDGGSDLVSADIPKSLMLLNGQNPYAVHPWASPYPPLLLATVAGIIRLISLFTVQTSLDTISQNVRLAGLFADASIAIIVYLYVRHRTNNAIQALLPAGLFLTLPALSSSPLYFFHSDTFGYPILALSLAALATNRYLIGTSLLATATIYKIHPILALPLIIIWLARTRGARAALPSLVSASAILAAGLALPLAIPGYAQSILGFNLSNDGDGTTVYATLGLINNILPQPLQITPTTLLANQIWISATLALFTIVLGIVWSRARIMGPVDLVLLGLLAWLIPLKIEYTHYIAWGIIPVLMRGRLKQTITILGLLQLADALSYWAWWPSASPFPGIATFYGLILTSAIYRVLGTAAFAFVLYSIRQKPETMSAVQRENWFPTLRGQPTSTAYIAPRSHTRPYPPD